MSEGIAGRSLSEVLEGHLPLTGNRHLIEAIEGVRKRPLLAIVLAPGARLKREMLSPLADILDGLDVDGPVDVLTDRIGTAGEESWRLVSTLREYFGGYDAIVPFAASTAASQVALGADRLVMGPMASLAPVEPLRMRLAEVDNTNKLPITADDFRHFLRFLNAEGDGVETLGAQMVERLDPLIVGATEKARQLHRLVTRRCLESHLSSPDDAAQVDEIVEAMCGGLLSHFFPVTRRDCEKRLGLTVVRPEVELMRAIRELYDYYGQILAIEGDFLWNDRHFSVNFDGFIDVKGDRRVLVRLDRVDERGRPLSDKPALVRWIRPGGQDVVMNEPVEL